MKLRHSGQIMRQLIYMSGVKLGMNTYYKKVSELKKGEVLSYATIEPILSLYNGTWWEGQEGDTVLILRDIKITLTVIENHV